MKKRLFLLFLLAMLPLLAGCLKQDVAVVMERNGGGSVACTFSVRQEVYEQFAEKGNDPFDGREYTITENGDEVWYSVTDVTECTTYDDMETALLALQFPLDLIDDPDQTLEIEKTPLFSYASIEKGTTLFTATYDFAVTVNPQTVASEDFDPDEHYKLKVRVEIPGDEVEQISGGQIVDGKAVFDVESVTGAESYSITTSERRWGMTVLVLAGASTALAALVWLPGVIRKYQERGRRDYL